MLEDLVDSMELADLHKVYSDYLKLDLGDESIRKDNLNIIALYRAVVVQAFADASSRPEYVGVEKSDRKDNRAKATVWLCESISPHFIEVCAAASLDWKRVRHIANRLRERGIIGRD